MKSNTSHKILREALCHSMVQPLLVMRGDINARLMLTGPLLQGKPSKIKFKSGVRLVGKHYPIEHESRRKCCNRSCKILGEN